MTVKSLLITGNYTEADLLELTAVFRAIERRQPDQRFLFAIIEADISMAEAQGLIKRIFPRLEDDEPTFQTMPLKLDVVCADGATREMLTDMDVDGFAPDIERPRLVMVKGTVKIDCRPIKGEAWFRDGVYVFTPT
jgi:hypothetical protein